jgi:type IX secretion system PorP/SprF family membrane protein
MKKQLCLFSIICVSFAQYTFAQQDAAVTHGMYTKMTFNPGATGSEDGICGSLIYRNQWDRVNGAPNTVFFNVEANLNRFVRNLGAGVSVVHDAIGFNRQNTAHLNLSYKIKLPNSDFISVGVGAGIVNMGQNPIWVTPQPGVVDNLLPQSFAATNMDFNFGIFYRSQQNFYVGISSTHLSESVLASSTSSLLTYNTARHYYLMGGWKKEEILSNWDLDLNTLLRTDMNKFSFDLSARMFYQQRFYGGVGFRNSDAVLVLLGMEVIPNLTIGYSYDITTNRLANISWGTHEIMLRYCRPIPVPPPTIHKNPRHL